MGRVWACYCCFSCGSVVSARGYSGVAAPEGEVDKIYPDIWSPSQKIYPTASRYLDQARKTLNSPDASVLMSSSSIDAMLKDKGLRDGSLHSRIEKAVEAGILTSEIAKWAHLVRLQSNNTRHADEETPHMTTDDAEKCFDFAKAIAEILYVLPDRIPKSGADESSK